MPNLVRALPARCIWRKKNKRGRRRINRINRINESGKKNISLTHTLPVFLKLPL